MWACAAGRSPKRLHGRTWADAEEFDVTSRLQVPTQKLRDKGTLGGLLRGLLIASIPYTTPAGSGSCDRWFSRCRAAVAVPELFAAAAAADTVALLLASSLILLSAAGA